MAIRSFIEEVRLRRWKVTVEKHLFRDVLFGGYYGKENIGDDCFGVISAWGARSYWNSRSVRLLSDHDLEGPVPTESCLSKKKKFRGQWLPESIWQIIKASCVVWSGGSIFHSRQPVYAPKHLSSLASRFGITPAGAIGVSLGPYRSLEHQRAVHRSLRDLRFLALRDKVSYEEALSIDLPYRPIFAADLAMLLPRVCPEVEMVNREEQTLGVVVCHYERYAGLDQANEARREKVLLEALLGLHKAGFEGNFRFFVFNGKKISGDKAVTLEFADRLTRAGAQVEIVPYFPDPIKIWKKVAQCTTMISVRLHGAIFAAAANVPICLIEYHPKCTNFLHDIGVQGHWSVGDSDLSSESLLETLRCLLDVHQGDFYLNRTELIDRAENNFLINDMVFRGE